MALSPRFLPLVLLAGLPLPAARASSPPPYLTDVGDKTPAEVASAAADALRFPIHAVMDHAGRPPSGDPHDYVSYARYWWPDPDSRTGLPFVQRDGHINEKMVQMGDDRLILHMEETVRDLALGWAVLHRADCARRAGRWLHVWFLDPATRMNPNLDYAQIRMGRDGNRNAGTGCLDGRNLPLVIDALGRLHGSPGLSAGDESGLRAWFRSYSRWLIKSAPGQHEHAAPNNHGSWYLVQAVAVARYVGDDATARRLCQEDFSRIARQIRPDGSQPLELHRADGLSYSVFNLTAQLELAELARPLGIDLAGYRAPGGGCLGQALAYLRPYNADPSTWPGHQLNDSVHAGFLQPLEKTYRRLTAAASAS